MTEIANLQTGELVEYDPMTPVEIEMLIRELGDRLERAVPVIKQLWNARYTAERKLIEERAKAVMRSSAATVTEKRAEADLATLQYRHEFDAAKETLHAAEELQKALRAKLSGFQSINKSVNAAYGSYGGAPR